ncbi:hypothetical protein N657DRAFT_243265 [Parathielavia appendiculata]|uniref:Uncharacterized protein n=1 Tax=Parathielavia appendiculata TaxID=2587402 RepID=A0AAN6TSF4_9PEZI|nr:hypothetical protein N657DRAFT_243265 [Parathielavia appendiculata]
MEHQLPSTSSLFDSRINSDAHLQRRKQTLEKLMTPRAAGGTGYSETQSDRVITKRGFIVLMELHRKKYRPERVSHEFVWLSTRSESSCIVLGWQSSAWPSTNSRPATTWLKVDQRSTPRSANVPIARRSKHQVQSNWKRFLVRSSKALRRGFGIKIRSRHPEVGEPGRGPAMPAGA